MTKSGLNRDIDHDRTDEVVCPYCGYVIGDSWEYHGDDGDEFEATCGNEECEKTFVAWRNVHVDYSSMKLEDARINKLKYKSMARRIVTQEYGKTFSEIAELPEEERDAILDDVEEQVRIEERKEHLSICKYDGLYRSDGNETCGCSLDDFMPCLDAGNESVAECRGGHKHADGLMYPKRERG